MRLKQLLQDYLGITEIKVRLRIVQDGAEELKHTYSQLLKDIHLHNSALCRIIAKLDPLYNVSEFDPDRIAASRKLEGEIMNKLLAEYKASNPHAKI